MVVSGLVLESGVLQVLEAHEKKPEREKIREEKKKKKLVIDDTRKVRKQDRVWRKTCRVL